MPSDVDKVYVKKHKINDMLNELYTELTSQKPDDPVLFAMKHFEKKLPKTVDRPQSGLLGAADILPLTRSSGLLDLANKPMSAPMETDLPPSANVLFSKLFSRLPPNANENIASNEKGLGGGQFALSTFNIINKLSRINAKLNNEMSMEEALEKENITYNKYKPNNEDEKPSKFMVTYKTSLKNRENALKHKNEIKDLVNREINKQINTKDLDMSGGETNYSRPGADVDYETSLRSMNDNVPAALRQEETDELNDEMLTTRRNYQRIETIKKRNKFRKFNAFATSARPGLQIFSAGLDPHASMTPRVNLIICQICSKIQSNVLEEKNDLMNRDFLSGVNHEHHQEAGKTAAPLLSAKEPQRVEKLPKPETPKTDAAQNPITSNPFLLDFFKGSIEQSKNIPKNSDNLDDGPIESASQVSGPRHIEPFELPTGRNDPGKSLMNRRESGVLAWVMARQVGSIGQDENAELIDEKKSDNLPSAREETVRREEKPPSRPASAVGRASSQVSKSGGANAQASPRTGVPETPRRAVEKKEGSTVDHQAWKVKDSDSDISTLSHKQTKNSKN